ncbi:MAG: dihydroorotase [Varibaculum cambriense]|uniref:dihydroorotase n=1 Tax=Varibaculum cambriense TaxID=184870 RepID=UPI002912D20D|nr:dihydroorotase [Varibaculum cambriense]MDU4944637.1 dihydroorotase [Varibaculum cambriense]
MGEIVFRGANILGEERADILIEGEVVRQVGSDLSVDTGTGVREVDARGLVALPGLVDLHTHLREPGGCDAETVDTGTAAAAKGGYTAVFAMANTTPTQDCPPVVEQVLDLGRKAGRVDVHPVGAVTKNLAGKELSDLKGMHQSRAAVNVFSDDGKCVFDPLLMRQALEIVRDFDGLIAQHSQEPRLTEDSQMNESYLAQELGLKGWPTVAEEMIIARDILLSLYLDVRVHICHLSSARAVELVRWGKSQGARISAEATPHHLFLTQEEVRGRDPLFKVNPPLRSQKDVEAVQAGLADGTIDLVGTDHAPHPRRLKDCDFECGAFGMIGLETALAVVATTMVQSGKMTWRDLARVMSVTPARIGRVKGQGEEIAPGAVANLCFVSADTSWQVHRERQVSRSDNTPFVGKELLGQVRHTIYRGKPTVLAGQLQF